MAHPRPVSFKEMMIKNTKAARVRVRVMRLVLCSMWIGGYLDGLGYKQGITMLDKRALNELSLIAEQH